MTTTHRIKVIVITLPEYPVRFIAMEPLLNQLRTAGLIVEIHHGVYGKEVKVTDTASPHLKHLWYRDALLHYNRRVRLNGQPMSAGEFGCAWSHYDLYKRLTAEADTDAYLVLEDDAELVCSLETILESLQHLPQDYDVIRTTASTWYPFIKLQDYNPYYYTFQKRFTNFATSYLVSKQGAQTVGLYGRSLERSGRRRAVRYVYPVASCELLRLSPGLVRGPTDPTIVDRSSVKGPRPWSCDAIYAVTVRDGWQAVKTGTPSVAKSQTRKLANPQTGVFPQTVIQCQATTYNSHTATQQRYQEFQ